MPRELTSAPESLFWYWIAERHRIFLRRSAGMSKPWTDDPILRDYKFTNPFRENDRGTVWLRENFLRPNRFWVHNADCPTWNVTGACNCNANRVNAELLAFNICWYRMFNWWGTGELLGWQTNWESLPIRLKLYAASMQGKQIFTGAHIVYSRPGKSKIDAIVDVCTALWNLRTDIVIEAQETKSLQAVFNLLQTVDCVGGFMGYEMVTDMRHTRLLEDARDIMTWANMGPGAQRGLRRLGLPAKNQKEGVESMRLLLSHGRQPPPASELWAKLSDDVRWEDYPELEMRDIEHSLCEFDKYCRVKFSEGEPRSKFNGR